MWLWLFGRLCVAARPHVCKPLPPSLPPSLRSVHHFTTVACLGTCCLLPHGDGARQVTHDLIEFQTLGSWAPIYFHEVLGVPLKLVGAYTFPPMIISMVGKVLVTVWEKQQLQRARAGHEKVDRLALR